MAYDRLVIAKDYGNLAGITAVAAGVVSGGFLVSAASGTNTLGSDASTVDTSTQFRVTQGASTTNFAGIALNTAASGALITIIQEGVFVLPVGSGAPVIGEFVTAGGYENMVVSGGVNKIGRALTTDAALTGFVLVKLDV